MALLLEPLRDTLLLEEPLRDTLVLPVELRTAELDEPEETRLEVVFSPEVVTVLMRVLLEPELFTRLRTVV